MEVYYSKVQGLDFALSQGYELKNTKVSSYVSNTLSSQLSRTNI